MRLPRYRNHFWRGVKKKRRGICCQKTRCRPWAWALTSFGQEPFTANILSRSAPSSLGCLLALLSAQSCLLCPLSTFLCLCFHFNPLPFYICFFTSCSDFPLCTDPSTISISSIELLCCYWKDWYPQLLNVNIYIKCKVVWLLVGLKMWMNLIKKVKKGMQDANWAIPSSCLWVKFTYLSVLCRT